MKNKRLKVTLIVICVMIASYLPLRVHVTIRMRTSDPCVYLIEFLKTDDEITEVCGEFHHASFFVTGGVKYGLIDYQTVDKDSGFADLRLKFQAENGKYIITAHLSGEDGIWTVTEYELTS